MGNVLTCKQILLTSSSRKCMGISLESLYVDIGALRVNLVLGTQETAQCIYLIIKNLTEDTNDF